MTSRRRALTLVTVGGVVALGPLARAQRRERPVRVGYLSGGASNEAAVGWLRSGFDRMGWVDGRDYVLKARFADLNFARFATLTDELLREGIDILIAAGPAARMVPAVQHAVPVVFTVSSDPVAGGLVRSIARPGGNATGTTQLMFELAGKRLELLREVAPQARRTAVIQSPDHPGEEEERRQTLLWGERLGFEMYVRQVRSRSELQAALADTQAAACDSLLCFVDPITLANRQHIAEHALRLRLPAVYPRRDFCEVGGLISYGPNMRELYARLAYFVERIAGGARASDLPVELPTAIETVVNQKTAAAIRLTLPSTILARADEVIE